MMTLEIDPVLRALADTTRQRVMRLLAEMELAVGELTQVLDQSQPRVSRHIGILCDAGLAERRKEGSWVFLRSCIDETARSALGRALAAMLAAAEDEDAEFARLCADDRQRLAVIRSAREAMAADYFARHAADWDRLRSLHIDDSPVEERLLALLVRGHVGPVLGRVLDVGTGTGRMAELFEPHARSVTGLDNSPEMLRVARARLHHLPTGQIDLVQGDFLALPFADGVFDTVVYHQVLHYAQNPEAVLAEAARVLGPGGRVAIVDFAAHEREDLRESHAHVRLGFGDTGMAALLAGAGFAAEPPVALAGHELTVKIWIGTAGGEAPAAAEMFAKESLIL